MIQAFANRIRQSTLHPLWLSLFVALFAVSDPARSSLLLHMLDTQGFVARVRGKLLRRAV